MTYKAQVFGDRRDKRRLWAGFVYVLTDDRHHCKIGSSRDVEGRLAVAQTHYPYDLRVACSIRFETEDQARAFENEAIRQCPWPRLAGDWFAAEPESLSAWIVEFSGKGGA